MLCALRCLVKTVEGSGIDEAWHEADLYGSVTVSQIINGNHHNRAVHAHQVPLQVLFDLWLGAFLDDHPAVRDSLRSAADELTDAGRTNHEVYAAHRTFIGKLRSLNLEKQLLEYDVVHEKEPMYKWARMYMDQVMVLRLFQRATPPTREVYMNNTYIIILF